MIALPKPMPLGSREVGQPRSRVDGLAKVTGQAKYAAEFTAPGLLHGHVVTSAIPRGRITFLDTSKAQAIPGVHAVLSHLNRPKTAWWDRKWKDQDSPKGSPFRPFKDAEIHFAEQVIAVVVADTPELARHAASLVTALYETEPHETDVRTHRARARAPSGLLGTYRPPPAAKGDADKALLECPLQVDAEYSTPVEHHNAMEMHASTVIREPDGSLTIHDKTQGVYNSLGYVCRVFGLSKKKVRVVSPYVGGAFGSGLRPQHQLFLAVACSLMLKRSVRVVLTRRQNFTIGHRPATLQRIALGATAEGRLQAMVHEVVAETSRFEDYSEFVTDWSALLYSCPNTRHAHGLVPLDIFTPLDMRAPGGALGVYAIETAIDELSYKAGIDPLEIRLLNYADRDERQDIDFSSKELRACYAQASERFGWSKRTREPRSMRNGDLLVGQGMATGAWEAMQMPAGASVSIDRDGVVTVAAGSADIGTGTYTIMAQIAAEALGLSTDSITVKLGDTDLPYNILEGGSWTAGSLGTAVMAACVKLKRRFWTIARGLEHSMLKDVPEKDVLFSDGRLFAAGDPSRGYALVDLIPADPDGEGLAIKVMVLPHKLEQGKYSRYTHAAVFVEVQVDEDLGRVQVTRIVSAIAGGRILNPKTARSQILGGMVWGIGMALQEETLSDHRLGRYLNHNLAEYHIPVHADIQDLEVIFVPEEDQIVNPIGVKGLGEIGLVGVAAAIGNAVYHATGKRIRDLPITLDKLLA